MSGPMMLYQVCFPERVGIPLDTVADSCCKNINSSVWFASLWSVTFCLSQCYKHNGQFMLKVLQQQCRGNMKGKKHLSEVLPRHMAPVNAILGWLKNQ